MLISLTFLVVGLILLVVGADLLVRGVSALAAAMGVPALVIGMTVVAFGTSTPELVVNVMSAAKGETGLAFGNIIGSSAINIGFVLAITALVRPLEVNVTVITREIPMMLLGVAAIVVLAEDDFFSRAGTNTLNRNDGIMLLLLFCVFLYYTIMQSIARRKTDPFIDEVQEAVARVKDRPLWIDSVMTLGGLIGVAVGGHMTVSGAVGIAELLSVSQAIIGLTLVSFGTTLPELTTGILAARRGQSDIAIGNVVGSCIYNLLFIGGAVATIHPMHIPPGGHVDLLMLAGLSGALLPLAIRGPRKITRAEGALLLAAYLAYVTYRGVTA